jgi:hypothetical protein
MDGFNLALQAVSHDYRKAFGTMRADILDALWGVNGEDRARILKALNDFQTASDWNFDLD